MEIKEELNALITRTGLSVRAFAKKVEIESAQMHKYVSGKQEPRLPAVQKIRAVYPDFMKTKPPADEEIIKALRMALEEKDKRLLEKDDMIALLNEKIHLLEARLNGTV